jgi:predicted DCC family thiol-disulfide oxidoreductase YuxK
VREVTILYDRDCGFCRWSLAKILAWDRRRRLRPLALQEPEAKRLLPTMTEEERMASWHLVTPAGERRSGGYAFPALLRRLPGGWPLAALAERLPRTSELGYRWVARRRGSLGRLITGGARRRADQRIADRERSGG